MYLFGKVSSGLLFFYIAMFIVLHFVIRRTLFIFQPSKSRKRLLELETKKKRVKRLKQIVNDDEQIVDDEDKSETNGMTYSNV